MHRSRTKTIMVLLIPVLFLLAGAGEACLYQNGTPQFLPHLFKQIDPFFWVNLCCLFINLAYGAAAGIIYLLLERQSDGKWGVSLPRFCLFTLPMLALSLALLVYYFHFLVTDTMGMPYLNFLEFYSGESPAAHMAFFGFGFFLIFMFSKSSVTSRKHGWLKCLPFTAVYIVFIILVSILAEKILRYAVLHQNFSYYTYELILLLFNAAFGVLLWKTLDYLSHVWRYNINCRATGIVLEALSLLVAIVPFVFVFVSYHTDFEVPYNNPYYMWLEFFRRADFFAAFQILFGLLLVPTLKSLRHTSRGKRVQFAPNR